MESERETMEFSQKLVQLRRREGLSQEQLADRLGVTRQSVSKWEGGAAMPDVGKLISLSELFGVSVDYLVKDYLEEPAREPEMDETQARRLEEKVDDLTRYVRGTVYAYDSKARILGIPLVSVRIGFSRHQRLSREHVARGIIAIGNAAVGVVAIGLISVGLISLGFLAVGMLALGAVAFGAAACGVAAMGIFGPGRQRRGRLCRRCGSYGIGGRRGCCRHGEDCRGAGSLRDARPAVGQRPDGR